MQLSVFLAVVTLAISVSASPSATTTTYKPRDRPKPRPTDLGDSCIKYKSPCTFHAEYETCCHSYKCSDYRNTCALNCLELVC
ncbi:hypothetical protein GGR58DRAFT_65600 [Xylaria digitata]|nr:hypothetical protein GGR58DRAFT_65600 [Xylaria digitata]